MVSASIVLESQDGIGPSPDPVEQAQEMLGFMALVATDLRLWMQIFPKFQGVILGDAGTIAASLAPPDPDETFSRPESMCMSNAWAFIRSNCGHKVTSCR